MTLRKKNQFSCLGFVCSGSCLRVRVFDPFRVSSTHARLFDRVAVSQTRSPRSGSHPLTVRVAVSQTRSPHSLASIHNTLAKKHICYKTTKFDRKVKWKFCPLNHILDTSKLTRNLSIEAVFSSTGVFLPSRSSLYLSGVSSSQSSAVILL